MIHNKNDLFVLETRDTSYCFRVMPQGHLEHLYYGRRINLEQGYEPLLQKTTFLGGTQIAYSKEFPNVGLEDLCLELSSYGKGDIREAFLDITHEDGSSTCDFRFRKARILKEKKILDTLPSAYLSDQGSEPVSLEIEMYDSNYEITLLLIYSVFYDSNVITRSAKLINTSSKKIWLERIMSCQLDLDAEDYIISTFHGAWAREMNRYDTPAQPGIFVNDSKLGISGNRSNPFFMISQKNANEEYGDCFGFNLIYSGEHYAAIEVNSMGKLRVVNGIQPANFRFLLMPGDSFEAPESVITFSNQGYTGMSHNMHHFIRKHILRGEWKNRVRPVLLNSWEANYFKFDEGKLLKQAKAAAEAGIELFVLDDGWFGNRKDDTSSLGDWQENREKLQHGLKGLADKINALGMDFGIWVEPEMVNEDSDCYRNHPDWAVKLPGVSHSLGRNQMLLDLTKEEVRSYLIDEMARVFSSANIRYVKWDMNRIFSDRYSSSLDADRQKEFSHRYIMGLYEVIGTLTRRFPQILFEGCASGGNRFDLGILCYMPQIWASDNTDAICRVTIQSGYSYGYPLTVMGAHVSGCPNHQTLRNTSIETRFEVAAFGLLGYECNLTELSKEEYQIVKEQIAFYKKHRETLQFGDFYRIKTNDRGIYQWLCVAPDQSEAIGLHLQKEVLPNYPHTKFKTRGLKEETSYHFTNRQQIFSIKEFGDLINMISPIHIKKDSLVHNVIAMVKKMPGEVEDSKALGCVFNHAGVKLKQAFAGTGYNEEVRLQKDFSSRMYLWDSLNE
ncbi:alpha-galactosidase [Lachnospiraceae bacterium MD1]|uniref:alpha-galactosidase n=1 Tax=Variimorphobacter saccharofermentans TaxID=2755051 RepID=A0A839K169_9FIRM|nr:alpha-galactosidase [Variimorphobacter saccharofermentans]MBB2182669.1 alpha-galactosidase [Variimorphobacter saccharofermentans]